ncbi:MAG: MoaD/ThiS family protein [Chloroflexota bacterium]|nr:MoaD/ThiS family protein [Chloroflexota bacterium]MDE2843556.1 MoaD/ThiS family protein [Chloroflexota bacterium]
MATVYIPTMLLPVTGGIRQTQVDAGNVRQLINGLEEQFPGIRDRLLENNQVRPNLAVSIDGEVARMGLLEKVGESSEVHFVPAISGG